ncbi:MAG: hypothetical protein COB33_002105 [Thiotrichaceae bacterium]|nr:hypothetical protein [Thiotrichaceae bacterium]
MKIEIWVPIIVGGIILVPLGFLGINVFDMKGTLSSVETKVNSTDNRVSRIADALPGVKARVAWEEFNHAIEGFIVVSKPKRLKSKRWLTTAAVYNRDSNDLKVYSVSLDSAHRNYASYVIAGKLKSENPYESSFTELSNYSDAIQQPVILPGSINQDTSFVLRSADALEMRKFIRTLSDSEPKTKKIKKIRNWKELVANIDELMEVKKEKK